jgi:hypothetical protein
MTSKVYKSAQGKSVDLGTIILQNEHVRAVGNMKVNARGDKLDSNNCVIETKPRQIQKQNERTTTTVSTAPVYSSSKKVRAVAPDIQPTPTPAPIVAEAEAVEPILAPAPVSEPAVTPELVLEPILEPAPVSEPVVVPPPSLEPVAGGLAEAIARSREIKQSLDKTRRQQAQDKGVRKF